MWDLIVSVPDHCFLSFFLPIRLNLRGGHLFTLSFIKPKPKKAISIISFGFKKCKHNLRQAMEASNCVENDGSFFQFASETIEKYELPLPGVLQTLSKDQWKLTMKKVVREYWTRLLQSEAEIRSTLDRCNIVAHPVWDSVKSNRMDVTRVIIKARMLTGTYLLQTHRKKFNMDGVSDATCPLCCLEDEDIVHMLTRCPARSEVKSPHLDDLKRCLQCALGPHAWSDLVRDTGTLVQLIIECQKLAPDRIPEDRNLLNTIDSYTRLLCYKLHLKRLFYTTASMMSRGVVWLLPQLSNIKYRTIIESDLNQGKRAPLYRRRIHHKERKKA